ncbi:hypothetical protein E2C01_042147 [Portunus trituberculatus]|uniref:Uncharacterized protein n=1 Tax=Portunus trituberculatus TaxID=210409 RepID=A0A5B7FS95_PORTR|nr:hypothetical protein [Portunus trituberculatus]
MNLKEKQARLDSTPTLFLLPLLTRHLSLPLPSRPSPALPKAAIPARERFCQRLSRLMMSPDSARRGRTLRPRPRRRQSAERFLGAPPLVVCL